MYLVTTAGKLIFNEILPDTFPYINEPTKDNIEGITPTKYFLEMGTNIPEAISKMELVNPFSKKTLQQIIAQVFKRFKTTETSMMLDRLKDLELKHIRLHSKIENTEAILKKIETSIENIDTTLSKFLVIEERVNNNTKDINRITERLVKTDDRFLGILISLLLVGISSLIGFVYNLK